MTLSQAVRSLLFTMAIQFLFGADKETRCIKNIISGKTNFMIVRDIRELNLCQEKKEHQ